MNLALIYPLKKPYDFDNLIGIPNKNGEFSGYYLLAIAESIGLFSDHYICFTNVDRNNVWIEKASIVSNKDWFCFDDLVKIKDEEEFNLVHSFLVKESILDEGS
jgi:hypothetical protein